jgi:heme A synthase
MWQSLAPLQRRVPAYASQTQTLIEFTHRATSGLSLVLVATLLIWAWRRTARGEWSRYSAAAAAILLFNEALLGAILVVFEHVGMDRSASRAVFLSLHFGNTLLLVAALTLTAKWLSNSARLFWTLRKGIGTSFDCHRVIVRNGYWDDRLAGRPGRHDFS